MSEMFDLSPVFRGRGFLKFTIMATASLIPIQKIEINFGQIEGLPKNPRTISRKRLLALIKSIEQSPEMLSLRELIVVEHGEKYVVIGGNMRLRACKKIGYKEIPCKILPSSTPIEKLREYVIKDNNDFGENDFDALSKDWGRNELESWGMEFLEDKKNVKTEKTEKTDSKDNDEKESFYKKMFKDCLYESDNIFEIPNLLLEKQAGKLELPFSPWGANSRIRKNVATYHFYVDDYRFEALFKNPIKLLMSGCNAIVEPNLSLHDQTPIAYGLNKIYKKRWLARYLQECGLNVYVDLNVSHKFIEYNKLGIPNGYNAFFTRGLTDWIESLKSDLDVARQISGLEKPNLIVYGGGEDIKDFCRKHSLLYITDFINAKK